MCELVWGVRGGGGSLSTSEAQRHARNLADAESGGGIGLPPFWYLPFSSPPAPVLACTYCARPLTCISSPPHHSLPLLLSPPSVSVGPRICPPPRPPPLAPPLAYPLYPLAPPSVSVGPRICPPSWPQSTSRCRCVRGGEERKGRDEPCTCRRSELSPQDL